MSRCRIPAGTGLVLGLGLAAACFSPPRPAVQFSCDPQTAPECPDDYRCQPDGCCHLEGTSFTEHEGECQLGGVPPGTDTTPPTTSSGSDSAASSSSTTTLDPTTSTSATTSTGGTDTGAPTTSDGGSTATPSSSSS